MEHITKYNIGDNVYWIEKSQGVYQIEHTAIKSINIGGKAHRKYEVNSYTTRAEVDLFDTFEEARTEALERQEKANLSALEIIKEYKDKNPS